MLNINVIMVHSSFFRIEISTLKKLHPEIENSHSLPNMSYFHLQNIIHKLNFRYKKRHIEHKSLM